MKIFLFTFILFLNLKSENIKCLTPFLFSNQKFEKQQLNNYKFDKPILQTFKISKSGFFKIFYDTTNQNGNLPSLVDEKGNKLPNTFIEYVNHVSEIFDSVLNIETTKYFFTYPPKKDFYEIYIQNLPDGVFGYTDENKDLLVSGNPKKYATFIVIDNDFGIGYRTVGLNALRATAAHEFFHSIQIGNYGIWSEEFYFYELTAESFEHLVFPFVYDFIFDLSLYFKNYNSISLFDNSLPGYERALWGIYLTNRFGNEFPKNMWNNITLYSPSDAIKKTISEYKSTLKSEFINFSFLNFTSKKQNDNSFYSFSNKMPYISFADSIVLNTQNNSFNRSIDSYTSNLVYFKYSEGNTFFVIVNNINDNLQYKNETYTLELNNYNAHLKNVNFQNWNLTVLNNNFENSKILNSPFPNPFRIHKTILKIPILNSLSGELEIYNSQFKKVYSNQINMVNYSGNNYLTWNGKDYDGYYVSSGVYYYKIVTSNETFEGKFSVIK